MEEKSVYFIGEIHLTTIDIYRYYKEHLGLTEHAEALQNIYNNIKNDIETAIDIMRDINIDVLFLEGGMDTYDINGLNAVLIDNHVMEPTRIQYMKSSIEHDADMEMISPEFEKSHAKMVSYLLDEIDVNDFNEIGICVGAAHVDPLEKLLGERGLKTEIIKTVDDYNLDQYTDDLDDKFYNGFRNDLIRRFGKELIDNFYIHAKAHGWKPLRG